jgi:hypothetical protein
MRLAKANLPMTGAQSHILPVMIRNASLSKSASEELM